MAENRHVLTLSCDGKPGIAAAVTAKLAEHGANLVEAAQFWDRQSNRSFLRIAFLRLAGFGTTRAKALLRQTGRDMSVRYKEISTGALADNLPKC